MSDSDRSLSGQAETISDESPNEAATSSKTKKSRRSGLCALEAAAGGQREAGETSRYKRVTGKVTDDEVGRTNKDVKVGKSNKGKKRRREDSDSLSTDSEVGDSDRAGPERKRFEKFLPEADTTSDTGSESEDNESLSSESDYEAYNPKAGGEKRKWKLPRSLYKYAKKHYTVYAPEEALKEILVKHPRPDHGFLRVEEIDDSIESGVKEKLGKFAADKILKTDETLRRAQEKVLRVAGPLLNLHKELNKVRKGKRSGKFKLENILRMVEKTVVLAGQANVGVRYARRLALTNVFTEKRKEAVKLLQKYDKQLQGSEELFGKAFQAKVEEDRGKEAHIGLLSMQPKEGRKFRQDKSQRAYPRQETQPKFEHKPFRGGLSRRGGRGGRTTTGWHPKNAGQGGQPSKPRYVTFLISHFHKGSRKRARGLLPQPRQSSTCGATGVEPEPYRTTEPPASGQSSVGSLKLGKTDKRSGNSANSERLQDPIHVSAPQGPGNVSAKVLRGRKQTHSNRDREIATEGCNLPSGQLTGPVSRPFISETEKGWVTETHLQLEATQQVCSLPALQDGGTSSDQKLAKQERVDGEIGFEGRLFLRHDERIGQEVDAVSMGKPTLRVSVPALRTGMCTKNFHEVDEAGCGVSPEIGHEAHLLPGRFSGHQFQSGTSSNGREDPGNIVGEFGLRNQHGEVGDHSVSKDRISGSVDRLNGHVPEPPGGQVIENSERMYKSVELRDSVGTTVSCTDREVVSSNGGNFASPIVLQTAAVASDQVVDGESVLRGQSSSDSTSQERAQMVVGKLETVQWPGYHLARARQGSGDGCQQDRMGCILSRENSSGPLDGVRKERAHQCFGDESSLVGIEDVPPRSEGHTCAYQDRQHDNSSTHKQIRRHEIAPPDRAYEGAVGFLSESGIDPDSRAFARSTEHLSRCSLQKETGWERLAARPGYFCSGEQETRPMLDRFVCEQDQQTATEVCQLEGGPRGSGGRCFPESLGEGDELHVSSLLPFKQVFDEGQSRESGSSSHCSDLAGSAMVPIVVEAGCEPSGPLAEDAKVVAVPGREMPPSDGVRAAKSGGLEDFRERTVAQGFSEEAASLLEKSWRKGTRSAYSSSWRRWAGWCDERSLDPFHAPVVHVVEFCSDMLKAGYEYSTINGFRSAISALHEPVDGHPIGQHPLVKRALAGVFNEKPPMPKYTDTWDVGQVLAYIKQLGKNTDLTDKVLTHKLTMLLALTTANRASELHGFNLEFMKDEGDSIEFVIHKLTKTRRVGQKPITVVLTGFPDQPEWDVLVCLRTYIRRSLLWRQGVEQHQLLLSTVPPHKPVVTSTISGWLKHFMAAAGLDTTKYQGHSVRSAATSRAKAAGLSVKEIMERANWRNAKTFHRFYDRSVSKTTVPFGTVICK